MALALGFVGCAEARSDRSAAADDDDGSKKKRRGKRKKRRARGGQDEAPVEPPSLKTRFDGPAPDGITVSRDGLGVPEGWKMGEFGIVSTGDGLGSAGVMTLPVWPPNPKHVKMQAAGHYAYVTPDAGREGKVGAKHEEAYVWELQGTCNSHKKGGKGPCHVWMVATKDRRLAIVFIKDEGLDELRADVPSILKPFGS